MTKEDIKNIRDIPGIYCIRNSENGKCYIGQSLFLRRRLIAHFKNVKTSKYDNPLYRAIDKYGIDKFEVSILETIESTDYTATKKLLDILEKKYIEEYKSYGNTGYNQTVGGDGGILGYKFTEEQKKRVSWNSKMSSNCRRVYLRNINTGYTQIASNMSCAARIMNICRTQISKVCSWKQFLIGGEWCGAFSIEELDKRERLVKEHIADVRKSMRNKKYKYSIIVYKDDVYYKTYKNTKEANEDLFHYREYYRCLCTVKDCIKNKRKWHKEYSFDIIPLNN